MIQARSISTSFPEGTAVDVEGWSKEARIHTVQIVLPTTSSIPMVNRCINQSNQSTAGVLDERSKISTCQPTEPESSSRTSDQDVEKQYNSVDFPSQSVSRPRSAKTIGADSELVDMDEGPKSHTGWILVNTACDCSGRV